MSHLDLCGEEPKFSIFGCACVVTQALNRHAPARPSHEVA
jgi:hypothetical protein